MINNALRDALINFQRANAHSPASIMTECKNRKDINHHFSPGKHQCDGNVVAVLGIFLTAAFIVGRRLRLRTEEKFPCNTMTENTLSRLSLLRVITGFGT